MARKWAKWFYNSIEWQHTRDYILKRDNYMCMCDDCKGDKEPAEEVHHIIWLTQENIHDPNISLNPDNLISISRDCHFKEHKHYRIRRSKEVQHKTEIADGYVFDKNGFPIQIKNTAE